MKHVNSATPLILLLSIECTLFAQTAGVGVGDCAGSKAVGCVLPNIYNGNKGVTLPPGQPGEHIAHFLEASGYTENFLPLINRFTSYYEEPPTIRLKEAFPQDAMDRLLGLVKKAIEAKNLDAIKALFHWQGASDSTREFVSSELQTLLDATILKIKIEPRMLNGNLIHWSAFQHYEPNLPVVGFLEIEYTILLKRFQEPSGPNKTLSLELGMSGNEFCPVNYVKLGERNLPTGRVDGLSMRGNTERLVDGTYLMTDLITNPGSLISAHLANEEIRHREGLPALFREV